MIKTLFEDYFNSFLGDRGLNRSSSDEVKIKKDVYDKLILISENYESLTAEHKKTKNQNDKLIKEIDDLKEDARGFKELQEENEKYVQSLLRIRADFDNYKKRTERDNEKFKQYATEKILRKIISHYDDLMRALHVVEFVENTESIKKGFEILVNNFKKILEEEGVRPMNCEGEKFDPYKHEAIMVEERVDLPENTILEELDKGYYFNNDVLRPAKVKISKKSSLENLNKNNLQKIEL